jgi:hypothetical protein
MREDGHGPGDTRRAPSAAPRRRRTRRIVVVVAAVAVVVMGLTAVVAVPSVSDLRAARAVLAGSATDLRPADVARADEYLESVSSRLRGVPARVLGIVPVIGPSLGAMRAVAESAQPVLSSGLDLKSDVDALRHEGLLEQGHIRLDALASLQGPLDDEVAALQSLKGSALDHRDGWVAPPVWDALDEIARRTDELRADADDFAALLRSLRDILGAHGDRRYLVMLLNNAELRGAGGVLTGLGSITIRDGRLGLGRFYPYESLRREPFETVPAPPDFERRYGGYGANTTIFINATYSPDVPERSSSIRAASRRCCRPTTACRYRDGRGS